MGRWVSGQVGRWGGVRGNHHPHHPKPPRTRSSRVWRCGVPIRGVADVSFFSMGGGGEGWGPRFEARRGERKVRVRVQVAVFLLKTRQSSELQGSGRCSGHVSFFQGKGGFEVRRRGLKLEGKGGGGSGSGSEVWRFGDAEVRVQV